MDICKFWTVPDNPPNNPDCLVVLSYAVSGEYSLTKPTQIAVDLAISWWKRFPNAKIIMSTGDNQGLGKTNATVMAEYAFRKGVPKSHIIEEGTSKDTVGNLIYSYKFIHQYKLKKVVIVMYDLHVRRMLRIAKKLKLTDFYWISKGGPGSPAYGIKYFQTYSRFTIFIYELLAYVYNILHGQI